MKYLLDSSAMLAALLREQGAEQVIDLSAAGAITAVNLAEVAGKLVGPGNPDAAVLATINAVGLPVLEVDEVDGLSAGLLIRHTRTLGFSLGDRICLAVARRRGLVAVTADRAWLQIASQIGVAVKSIR